MGCDIHTVVQARLWLRIQTWEVVPRPPWFSAMRGCEGLDLWWEWYRERNYAAFGILAGVRRDEFETVVPRPCRGLPPDLGLTTEEVDLRLGDHSRHWLTLRELVDFSHWDDLEPPEGETVEVADARPRLVQTYAACAGGYYSMWLPALRRWAGEAGVSYEDVRVVMRFDS